MAVRWGSFLPSDRLRFVTFRGRERSEAVLCVHAHLRTLQSQKNSCSARMLVAYSDFGMERGAAPNPLPVRA
jgi:hypothetical protein